MRFLCYILIQFLFVSVYGQATNSLWFFGDRAGVDFRKNSVTTFNNHPLISEEGTASICDENGELLFYTNGEKIWDSSHKVMLNGDSLLGHQSSKQSALIIKMPESDSLYFVFTSGVAGNRDLVAYSIVNMDQNNGLGKVELKNEKLFDNSAEVLTGTRHANGKDFWMVTRDRKLSKYYVYLVTKNGVSPPPVVSDFSGSGNLFGRGLFTSNGKHLLSYSIKDASTKGVVVSSFNRLTGEFESHEFISSDNSIIELALSYDDRFLFTIESYHNGTSFTSGIFRYDFDSMLSKGNMTDALKNKVVGDMSVLVAMRLAQDKNIYVLGLMNVNFLSVIEKSRESDTSYSFKLNKLNLGTGKGIRGLPNYVIEPSSFYRDTIYGEKLCLGDTSKFWISPFSSDSIQWEIEGDKITTYDSFVSFAIDKSGKQLVNALIFKGKTIHEVSRSFEVKFSKKPVLGRDTMVCLSDKLVLYISDSTQYDSVIWSNGKHSYKFKVDSTNRIIATGYKDQCTSSDTITVVKVNCQINMDTSCVGSPTQFWSDDNTVDSITWTVNTDSVFTQKPWDKVKYSFEQSFNNFVRIQYWYKDLVLEKTTNIFVEQQHDKPEVVYPQCLGDLVSPTNLLPNWDYQWSGLSSNQSLKCDSSGLYVITTFNQWCTRTDTFLFMPTFCDCSVYMPTAFSPNNNDINDKFGPISDCPTRIVRFTIFNRWGERIYDVQNSELPLNGWTGEYLGKECQSGYYFWLLEAQNESVGMIQKSGIIHLIR